jgi:hypothetical protein
MADVEEFRDDDGRMCLKVSTPKYISAFLIKPDQQGFYGVSHEGGGECAIKGKFTNLEYARKETVRFIDTAKMTQGAINEKRADERQAYKEKNASRVPA